jgi:hypothetical protein
MVDRDAFSLDNAMDSLWNVSKNVADMITHMENAGCSDDEPSVMEFCEMVGEDFAAICYDLCIVATSRGVNLLTVIQRKLEINEIRPRLHGKQF